MASVFDVTIKVGCVTLNQVYGKLKPLQEKVKFIFFVNFITVSVEKKSAQKINPAIGTEALFDYKNGRNERIRIFLAKRDVPPGAH